MGQKVDAVGPVALEGEVVLGRVRGIEVENRNSPLEAAKGKACSACR